MTGLPVQVAALARQIRDEHVRALDGLEADLVRAWSDAWDTLEPEFTAALLEVLTEKRRLGRVSVARIARARRLAQTLKQAHDAVADLLTTAGQQVNTALPETVAAALAAHEAMAAAQTPTGPAARPVFDRVDPGQVDAIVRRTAQQITAAHLRLPDDVEASLRRALVRGITVGENPRPVAARLIRDARAAFTGGLPRATMIARTEMLDATRAAAQAWDTTNQDVLAGWTWLCALDKRSCAACVRMHGTEHPVTEPGPEGHQNCRCTRAPLVKAARIPGVPEDTRPTVQTGPDWWAQQDTGTQDAVLGRTRADLLRSGKVTWDDLVTRRTTTGWRDSLAPTPIQKLTR